MRQHCTGESPYLCPLCDMRYANSGRSECDYECIDETRFEGRLKRTWKKHMIVIHSGEYPYVCSECD